MENVVIIGSGPAGLTAAIYTARAFLSPVVISGPNPGGQLIFTTEVENFPGFDQGILGPELIIRMKNQAERFGTRFIEESVNKVNFKTQPFQIITDNQQFLAKTVIIATGARWRLPGLPNEQQLLGKGIHTCATCDGAFYKDKEIIVLGGGDSALEEVLFLSRFAKKITIIFINNHLDASKVMQNKIKNIAKIKLLFSSEIIKYIGKQKLEAVEIKNRKTNQTSTAKIDGLFIAIGQIPNTEIFKGQLSLGRDGFLQIKNQVFSNISGIFVAGDVSDYKYRQAITAAGQGCMAALEAEKYLSNK